MTADKRFRGTRYLAYRMKLMTALAKRPLIVAQITLSAMIIAAFLPTMAHAGAKGTGAIAKSARLGGDLNRTRFVADLSKPVDFNVFTLPNPYRVIIDLPTVKFHLPDGVGRNGKGLVTAFRYGLFAKGKSRIVIDVKSPVLVEKAFVVRANGEHPDRLVIDIVATSRAEFEKSQKQRRRRVASVGKQAMLLPVAPSLLSTGRPKGAKPVIVIDPGHGGIDSGAIGITKLKEKDIILAFSKALRKRLQKTGRYKVLMTREIDVYVPLRDRVRFARQNQCELFISVHADSAPGRSGRRATGGTVYTLSERGSDREARLLAKKENRSDIIAGVELPGKRDVVTDILIDLAQRETNNLSTAFATTLISSMRGATVMKPNAHKSAAFVVLKAPDVPSVLIELGYLTNRSDEKRLNSPAVRDRIAGAVTRAVNNYFSKRLARAPF